MQFTFTIGGDMYGAFWRLDLRGANEIIDYYSS